MAEDYRKEIMSSAFEHTQKHFKGLAETLKDSLRPPEYPAILASSLRMQNPAEWAYERLVEYIKKFELELDEEHEIGARLVTFGNKVVFHIEDISYWGPDIITFYGVKESGEKVQLIQHISQISVLLIAVKKLGEKPRRIGFLLDKNDKKEEGDE